MSDNSKFFQLSLLTAALLCNLVFGFILIFAIVVMPGIAELDDGGFLRAFQAIDGVIQRNQPVFVSIWIGSVLALIVTCSVGLAELETAPKRAWFVVMTLLYIVAQVTTFTINVPLNNVVKHLDIPYLDASTKRAEREAFEHKWNFWNKFRAVIFGLVSIYLLTLLLLEDSDW